MPTAIKVENLSKIYQIGEIGTGTLSRDLERWWVTRILGKEDPFLKIGQTNERSKKGESDVVYSLKDINFEIEQGDAVGIIGKNGAGKSTLLKILSRVTSPTSGKIQMRGRVASLLEVGTGFHGELTGRENIYLNGAILGMRKKEITRKLDEIVDFSGIERYIDTPVKRYSSGMYVRLAFAVAAHLESEILIVDEVLAVGDAEFQKKCLGKMGEVSKGEGRTVLFVSHNMASVKTLCKNGMLLESGNLIFTGDANSVVKRYLGAGLDFVHYRHFGKGRYGFELIEMAIGNSGRMDSEFIEKELPIDIKFQYDNLSNHPGIYLNVKVKDEEGKYFMSTTSYHCDTKLKKGNNSAILHIPGGFFNEGIYSLDVKVIGKDDKGYTGFFSEKDVLMVQIVPEQGKLGDWTGKEVGFIQPQFEWSL